MRTRTSFGTLGRPVQRRLFQVQNRKPRAVPRDDRLGRHEGSEHALEMAAVDDKEPIEALRVIPPPSCAAR